MDTPDSNGKPGEGLCRARAVLVMDSRFDAGRSTNDDVQIFILPVKKLAGGSLFFYFVKYEPGYFDMCLFIGMPVVFGKNVVF